MVEQKRPGAAPIQGCFFLFPVFLEAYFHAWTKQRGRLSLQGSTVRIARHQATLVLSTRPAAAWRPHRRRSRLCRLHPRRHRSLLWPGGLRYSRRSRRSSSSRRWRTARGCRGGSPGLRALLRSAAKSATPVSRCIVPPSPRPSVCRVPRAARVRRVRRVRLVSCLSVCLSPPLSLSFVFF